MVIPCFNEGASIAGLVREVRQHLPLVLVVDEGGSARAVIGDESAVTIRTAICGIVDRVDIDESANGADGRRAP